MKPKTKHFQAISQANARTVRWPWLFLLGVWLLIRNLIIDWFSHFSPIPTAKHTIPRRKPLRRSADWELLLTKPRHYRRSIAQVLMQANVVGEVDALGHPVTRTYDSMGRMLKETRVRAGSTGTEQLVTSYTYNAKGELIESKSADGAVSKTKYNAIGKAIEMTDAQGRVTKMEYDNRGMERKTIYPDSGFITSERGIWIRLGWVCFFR